MSIGEAAAQDMTKPTLNLPWDCRNLAVRPRTRDVPAETGFSPAIYIYMNTWLYDYYINSNHVDMEKLCHCEKKHVFFEGVWFFLHTLSPTGYASAANHTPPFWPYWGPVGPLLPPFGPGFSSAQHFHPKKNIEKFMPCDLKGGDSFNMFQVPMWSCSRWPMKTLTYLDICRCQKKKSASNVSNFGSQSLWVPVVLKKDPVSRNWCSASLLFHPSSSRPWLTSSLPSVTSKHWKKKTWHYLENVT